MSREAHVAAASVTLGDALTAFDDWLVELGADRLIFWSDNPAFDWQWIHHGFQVAGRANPFGHSGRRIGDLYAGLSGNAGNVSGWKKRRQTAHDHDPLNDAKGNAEALLSILTQYDQLKALSIPAGAKRQGVATA
ncbi:3'-5' exoribonuclease domain-containing protein [Sphingomonas sanxanigenens]|nr:3'-5' exoribonuclease [Sphingomonas sanxanigenens]